LGIVSLKQKKKISIFKKKQKKQKKEKFENFLQKKDKIDFFFGKR
jgi:hypothetical protein